MLARLDPVGRRIISAAESLGVPQLEAILLLFKYYDRIHDDVDIDHVATRLHEFYRAESMGNIDSDRPQDTVVKDKSELR